MSIHEEGKISVTAENILPIIKKWLYSEHDIFIRELVSNAMDAITKHKHLSLTGEASQKDVEYKIRVTINDAAKTISIRDNGLGMSGDEIKRYIAEVAFSGATEFVNKYKGAQETQQIIGHFGLGFYSSFMVADKVEVRSRSFREGEVAVCWSCDGSTSYTLDEISDFEGHGTEITLYINSESEEFLKEWELKNAMRRHSGFLPVPLFLNENQINEQPAIWNSQPNTLKDEDYEKLYQNMFPFQEKPLFHIHFNLDSPFQLRGILWFQKMKKEFESFKGRIKLFCNQVFVSDAIEDIFPNYLFMLQGVIDCPEIPLNVSRSALQGDPRVKKIGQHIVKKIADKLKDMHRQDQEKFESLWNDISPFVKFGVIQDEKFAERVSDLVIFQSTPDRKFTSIKDYLEKNHSKHENKVYYCSDTASQSSSLELFQKQGIEVLIMDNPIDVHYMQHMEMHNKDWKFLRIDSELDDVLLDKDKKSTIVDKDNKTREDNLKEVFESALKDGKVSIRVENLKSPEVSGMILLPEHMRRYRDMSAFASQKLPETMEEHTFVINAQNPVVNKVLTMKDSSKGEEAHMVARHLYDLALISQRNFDPAKMADFVERSNKILSLIS